MAGTDNLPPDADDAPHVAVNLTEMAPSAEADLAPPPMSDIQTRPSIIHLVLGNLLSALAFYVALQKAAPLWILLVGLWACALLFMASDARRKMVFTRRFNAFRRPVLDQFAADNQLAPDFVDSTLQQEFDDHVNWSPSILLIALPGFLAPLIILSLTTFNTMMATIPSEWWILFRWAAAGASTFFLAALPALLLASGANNTPALQRLKESMFIPQDKTGAALSGNDRNDVEIIRQEAQLKNLHQRIETYTLESALLSALSFTSFLSIILADRPYFEQLPGVFDVEMHCYQLTIGPQFMRGDLCYPQIFDLAYLQTNLTSLICLNLLLCATMFLGVLVARLRFNDGYREAETALRTADRFNEKEEEFIRLNNRARAQAYTFHIQESLESSESFEQQLKLNVRYMRHSRDAGVMFFIFALILCGLYFHHMLSVVLLFIFILSMAFGMIDRLLRSIRAKQLVPSALKEVIARKQ